METIQLSAKYHQVEVAKREKKENFISRWIAWLNPTDEVLQENHFGIMSFVFVFQVCVGSIACTLLLNNGLNNVWFAACVVSTMALLVAAIAQFPTRWMLYIFYVAISINIFIILYCLL